MTYKGKTVSSVFLSIGALCAFAFVILLTFALTGTAQSQQEAAAAGVRGPFMLAPAGDDRLTVWRIDQSTGRVSYCVRDTQSQDSKFIATRSPFCSAWSQ